MARTSLRGTGAPAIRTRLSPVSRRSFAAHHGATRDQMAGEPKAEVARWVVMASTIFPGRHSAGFAGLMSGITLVIPKAASKRENSGKAARSTSPGLKLYRAWSASRCAKKFRTEYWAPLAGPVLPEVKRMAARSSAARSARTSLSPATPSAGVNGRPRAPIRDDPMTNLRSIVANAWGNRIRATWAFGIPTSDFARVVSTHFRKARKPIPGSIITGTAPSRRRP